MSRRGETPFSGHPRIPCSAAGAPLQPDVAAGVITWPPRCYACSFCGREFNSAQALGGHMNIHRRDRARLRTNSDHHSSNSTHHDWPPTTISDRNTPPPLSISSNNTAGFGSTQLHPPFQTAAYKYCSQDPSSSVTYNSSPIGHISEAAAPFKLQGSSAMIPASDQRSLDYNSSSSWPSVHSIPRVICVSNSANSPAALHSPQFPKSSSFITSPELMKGTPLNADLLICGTAEAAAARASRSHVGVAGTHVGVHELIQFKELAHEVEHSKRRSRGEELLNDPIQRPLQQYCIERPCSAIAKDSDCARGKPAAAVSSSPNYKDSLGCLDLELRLGRRSCLSAAGAAASPGNSNILQPPSPPDHDRRPP